MANSLILFGAGASYGSDSIGTPPLGAALFDELQHFNPPGWGRLPSDISDVFLDDFEAGMRNLSKSKSHAMPPLQRAMAAYFFNFIPRTTNLYVQLGRRIVDSKWKGAIATLNYERLLELSLLHVGLQPVVNTVPQGERHIELCLPHGCCHIFCETARGGSRAVSMSGVGISTSGRIIVITNPSEFLARITRDAFPPVMSYFEPQKRTTSGVNFIRSQRARWTSLVSEASIITLIGIRVRSDDEHIWNPLTQTKGELIYCSGARAAEEFDDWKRKFRSNADDRIIPDYFAESFDQICSEVGLC